MPQPRTASKLLELRGAFKQHPERRKARAHEPKPTAELGRVPARLTDAEKKVWAEIVKHSPPGVLKNSDRVAFEILVVLVAEFREKKEAFQAAKLTQLNSLLSRFGFTPSDRSRVIAEVPKVNKYADD